MSKITTADCVKAISAKAAERLPKIAKDYGCTTWTRLSKTGRKGEPVVREFICDKAPFLAARVVETGDALEVILHQMPVWRVPEKLHEVADEIQWSNNPPESYDEFHALGTLVRPEDFIFEIVDWDDEPTREPDATVQLYPIDEDSHGVCVDCIGAVYGNILPKCADGSVPQLTAESCYTITGKTKEQVEAELVSLGFILSEGILQEQIAGLLKARSLA